MSVAEAEVVFYADTLEENAELVNAQVAETGPDGQFVEAHTATEGELGVGGLAAVQMSMMTRW